MPIGLKIAKLGYSINDSVENLIMDIPDNPPPKVHAHGADTIVCTWDGANTTGSKTINHGLGYIPFALVYIEETASSGNRYLLNAVLPGILVPFNFKVNNSDIIITANGIGNFAGTYNLYYYIFLDEI